MIERIEYADLGLVRGSFFEVCEMSGSAMQARDLEHEQLPPLSNLKTQNLSFEAACQP